MFQMQFRFPRIFGVGVTFPRDQVLSSARGSLVGMNVVHLIFLFSFDELARLGNEVGTKLRSFLVGRKERSMKDIVHIPDQRKTKMIGIREDNLKDFKGALLLKGQFLRREVDLQVSRVKPDLCSYFPGGELCSNPFLDCLSCLSMSSGSLFVSSIEKFKLFVKSREECLSNWRIGLGLKAHHEQEWCLVGNRMDGRVMRELGHR